MKFIKPITISEGMISEEQEQQTDLWYTNEAGALVDVAAWVPSSSVATGDRRSHAGKVWQALSNHSGNIDPEDDPTRWAFVAPTNRWAAFDNAVGSAIQRTGSLSFKLTPGKSFDSFGCLGMVGESLSVDLQVPGSSNLQAYGVRTLPTGNWNDVAYGDAFLAVGSSGGAYSVDGATWTARAMPSGDWKSVSYGAGFWLAASEAKPIALITRSLPESANWAKLSYGDGVWLAGTSGAVSGGGTFLATSTTNGASWLKVTLPANSQWGSKFAFGNDVWVGVGYNQSAQPVAAKSATGQIWAQHSIAGISYDDYSNFSVCFSDVLGKFVVLVTETIGSLRSHIYSSTNGETWVNNTGLDNTSYVDFIAAHGKVLALASSGTVAVTTDLDTWTYQTLPTGNWVEIEATPTGFIALSTSGQIAVNTNGSTTWTQQASISVTVLGRALTVCEGLVFVAAEDFVSGQVDLYVSRDNGATWVLKVASLPWDTTELLCANGYLMSSGSSSASVLVASLDGIYRSMAKSTNATTWTETKVYPYPNETTSYKLASSSTHHVAVSPNKISYTTNGTSFTNIDVDGNWRDVDFVGDRFIAVSQGSVLAYATDPNLWTVVELGTVQTWSGSAFGSGRYVVISEGTKAAVSADGQNFTLVDIPAINAKTISFGNGLFVIVGDGKALTSPDGTSWLEFTGGLVGASWLSSAYANVGGTDTFVALASNKAASAVMASSIYKTTIPLIEDEEPVIDYWTWCFAGFKQKDSLIVTGLNSSSYDTAIIKITINGAQATDVVKLGTFSFGQSQDAGAMQRGMVVSGKNYSTYDTDDFGTTRITPRGFAKKVEGSLVVPIDQFNGLLSTFIEYKDVPMLFFPTGRQELTGATLYGHLNDWKLTISYDKYILLPIVIHGLT